LRNGTNKADPLRFYVTQAMTTTRVWVYQVIIKSCKGMDCGADSAMEYGVPKAVARHLKFGQTRFATRDNEFRIQVKKRYFTSQEDVKVAKDIFHDVADLIDADSAQHVDCWMIYPHELTGYENEPEVEPEPEAGSDEDDNSDDDEEEPTEEDNAFVVESKRRKLKRQRRDQSDSDSEWEEDEMEEDEEEDEDVDSHGLIP